MFFVIRRVGGRWRPRLGGEISMIVRQETDTYSILEKFINTIQSATRPGSVNAYFAVINNDAQAFFSHIRGQRGRASGCHGVRPDEDGGAFRGRGGGDF